MYTQLFSCDVQVAVRFTDCAGLAHHFSVEEFTAASFVKDIAGFVCVDVYAALRPDRKYCCDVVGRIHFQNIF